MTDIATRPLTIRDTVALAEIIRWAQTCAQIRWVDPNTGNIETGTARSIGDEQGNFTPADADIRDEHLRITTSKGWEWFVPMRDVMSMVMDGRMADA